MTAADTATEVTVYVITDDDGNPKYVGQTVDVNKRLREHWSARYRGSSEWAGWLTSRDTPPPIVPLEVVPSGEHFAAEKKWMQHFIGQGHDLLNPELLDCSKGSGAKIPEDIRRGLAIEAAKRGIEALSEIRNQLARERLAQLGYDVVVNVPSTDPATDD